jgi:hypothetical protein
MDDWIWILQGFDCMLVVLDPQPARLDANAEHLAFLRRTSLAGRGCFVISKSDLPTSMPVPNVSQLLDLDSEPFSDWPTYETTTTKPDTLLVPSTSCCWMGEIGLDGSAGRDYHRRNGLRRNPLLDPDTFSASSQRSVGHSAVGDSLSECIMGQR